MGNFFGLPPSSVADIQIFQYMGIGAAEFQMWQKPRGVSVVYMMTIGGGGGGGCGRTRALNANGGGGGGGACSGGAKFICPALLLPDVMYVQVGEGGLGGIGGTDPGNPGAAGGHSYISTSKTLALPNLICYSGAGTNNGGGGGTSIGPGAAGAVPSIAVTQPCNTWGLWSAWVGLAGAIGGGNSSGVGANITAWAVHPMCGGAGGTGVNVNGAGGSVLATATLDLGSMGYLTSTVIPGGASGGGAGKDGGAGIFSSKPYLFQTGGSGGANVNGGIGGHGGNGGVGCGGGGSGSGTTGGNGGNGGNGLVMIISW